MDIKSADIVIVGGGSAGWMTAAHLTARHPTRKIIMIEPSRIGVIGVGESTTPTFGLYLDSLVKLDPTFDKAKFLTNIDSVPKLAVKLDDWSKLGERWFHPFGDRNNQLSDIISLNYQYQKLSVKNYPYSYLTMPPFSRMANENTYGESNAYHINALKLISELKAHFGTKQNVTVLDEKVINVGRDDNGISHLDMESGTVVRGKLYVDCTGFARVLIGPYGKFSSYPDIHVNTAMVMQIERENLKDMTPHYSTRCTAQKHGWIWEIHLGERVGTGYVYCSDYVNEEDAAKEFLEYWVGRTNQPVTPARSISFKSGEYTTQCYGNVVANGLSAAFIEPLESTNIQMFAQVAKTLGDMIERDVWFPTHAEHRRMMSVSAEPFVSYHYLLTSRTDTPFWADYKAKFDQEKLVAEIDQRWTDLCGGMDSMFNFNNWCYMIDGMGMRDFLRNYLKEKLQLIGARPGDEPR